MHFDTKSYLKSTRNYTAKHALDDDDDRSTGFVSVQPSTGDDHRCRSNVGFALIPWRWNQGILILQLEL
jgi:hypothetical protein